MKIKKLVIHNIASIVDATIDFESPVLADANVFLITGDTGSGKSTILDSICLALYNTAPRLKGTLMEGKVETGQRTNITLGDPRQLLRRNTGEGFVELTFEGNNGRIYTLSWIVQRAYKRPDGNLQDVRRVLVCGGTTYTRGEVDRELRDAVGMTYEQFCRTTMLAQGEFTRFLNSKDKAKAEVLEQILDVGVYDAVSRRIYARFSAEAAEFEKLQVRVRELNILSDDERAALCSTLENAMQELERMRAGKELESVRLQWLRRAAEYTRRLEEASRRLAEAGACAETETHRERLALLADLGKSASALESLARLRETHRRIKAEMAVAADLQNRFLELCSGLQSLREQYKKLGDERVELDKWFESQSLRMPLLEKWQEAETLSRQLDVVAIELKNNKLKLEDLKKIEPALLQDDKAAAERLGTAQKELDEIRRTIAAKTEEFEKYKVSELRKRASELAERSANVLLARNCSEALEARKNESEEVVAALAKVGRELQAKEKLRDEYAESLKERQSVLDGLRLTLERASQTMSEWAKRMRGELRPGDVCPVCRHLIEAPLESDSEIEAALEPLRESVEKQLAAVATNTTLLNDAKAEISALLMRRSQLEKDGIAKKADCDKAARQLDEVCGKLAITPDAINAEAARVAEERDALVPKIAMADKAEQELAGLRQLADARQSAKDAANVNAIEAGRKLADLRADCDRFSALIDSETRQRVEIEERLGALVCGDWCADWQTEGNAFRTELRNAAELLKKKKEETERLAKSSERMLDEISVCEGHRVEIEKLAPTWACENLKSRPIAGAASKFAALAALTRSHIEASEVLSGKLSELQSAVKQYLSSDGAFGIRRLLTLSALSSAEVQSVREEVEKVKTAFSEAKSVKEELGKSIEAHNKVRPEMPEGDSANTVALRLDELEKAMAAKNQEIGDYTRRKKDDDEKRLRLATMLTEVESRRDVLSKWERLNALFGSADGKKFSKIALQYVLNHLLDKANVYLRQIMPRYRLHGGDGFVIMVEDAYQNGAMRSANVISGGESFIVSLALALALSDVGNRLKVDILFIDEGFGTLSGEALESAVDTLGSLRAGGGRRVGIISHVAALRERIGSKICVSRSGQSASTITVTG